MFELTPRIQREKQALETLAYYHADGNIEDPLVQFEFEEIKAAIENEKLQKQTGWLQLFKTPGNRKRVRIIVAIAIFSQWSGSGLVYVYSFKASGVLLMALFCQIVLYVVDDELLHFCY